MTDFTAIVDDREIVPDPDELDRLDIRFLGPEEGYHLLRNGRSYRCRIIDRPGGDKPLTVSINGRELEVRLEDDLDALIRRLGFRTVAATASGDARAPMPGLILDLMVAEGDEVRADQPLLVLEAMKMENVVKSGGAGTVQSVHVTRGEAVEKNQLLIEIA
jgi:biotin carboxyl carrier protein